MSDLSFDVHPSVVLKLGEELVADEFTAILETAKNSYDAGATRIIVDVEPGAQGGGEGTFYPESAGRVVIDDNGVGMELDDVELGWLLVAHSQKRGPKRRGKGGKAGRVPLGDKGIGRLGLQRIGDCVEVFTRTDANPGESLHVGFRWSDFGSTTRLSDIEVLSERIPSKERQKPGTTVVISQLRDPEIWKGVGGRDRLRIKLSELVSPFTDLLALRVILRIDGDPVDLASVAKSTLEAADQAYEFEFTDETLTLKASFTWAYLENAAHKKEHLLADLKKDKGVSILEQVAQQRTRPRVAWQGKEEVLPAGEVVFQSEKKLRLEDLGGVSLFEKKPASPGPFRGKIYHVPLQGADGLLPSSLDRKADLRALVREHSGVRVFRNGFAVRPYGIGGDDWLQLRSSWTSGRSFYGLRPDNTIGFVAITAADNQALEEKTDREGFIDTPASRNFIRLVREVAHEALQLNTRIRRALNVREKELIPAEPSPEEGRKQSESLRKESAGLRRNSVGSVVPAAKAMKASADVLDALSAEVERLKEEVTHLVPLASLGITAEAVTHELANIADALAARERAIRQRVRAAEQLDQRFVVFVEHVRSTVNAIRKQLSHIAPSLRYARERKDLIPLDEFTESLREYHQQRLAPKGIEFVVRSGAPATIRMNQGKLTQVLDNLILNSEYWVKFAMERNRHMEPRIGVVVDGPSVTVEDNGPGVAKHMEDVLFEAFETAKEKGRGRGLGLYIARQLLDTEGAAISLQPERNEQGRRYRFRIDLSSVEEGANG